jgi:hypothetical protein
MEAIMKDKSVILATIFSLMLASEIYSQSVDNSSENRLSDLTFERDWWHYSAGITFNQYQKLDRILLKYNRLV